MNEMNMRSQDNFSISSEVRGFFITFKRVAALEAGGARRLLKVAAYRILGVSVCAAVQSFWVNRR